MQKTLLLPRNEVGQQISRGECLILFVMLSVFVLARDILWMHTWQLLLAPLLWKSIFSWKFCGIKSTERKRNQKEWKKQALFRHLSGMEITQFYENTEIHCSKEKKKIFSTDFLLFINIFFSPEECCWWWSESHALEKRLAESLACSYSGGNTYLTLLRLFLNLESCEISY